MKKVSRLILVSLGVFLFALAVTIYTSCSSNPRPFPEYNFMEEWDNAPDGIYYRRAWYNSGFKFMIGGVPSIPGTNTSASMDPRVYVLRNGQKDFYIRLSFKDRNWLFMERLFLFNAEGVEIDLTFDQAQNRVNSAESSLLNNVTVSEVKLLDVSNYLDKFEEYMSGTNLQAYLIGRYRVHLVMTDSQAKEFLDVINFYRWLKMSGGD
jgi:hypothetical protein